MTGRRHRTRREVIPDSVEFTVSETSKAEELKGKLGSDPEEQKLMRSVLENDEETINRGKLLSDAINQGFSSFVPDLTFDSLVKNFSMTRNIYGDSLLRLITGYSADYLKKNINIPEFQRELSWRIEKNIEGMKQDGLLTKQGMITENGLALASLILYTEELDKLVPKGFEGTKEAKEPAIYGDKDENRSFRKGDRFRDIDIRKTLRKAIRRGRKGLMLADLETTERRRRGEISIVYGIDASGSMKGKKIEAAKKAGIALSFKAIENKDKVGLIVFGTDIEAKIEPSLDFISLLREITKVKAVKETNITATIREAIRLFPKGDGTRHLVLITDAVPTIGKNPEKETLEAASSAYDAGITISLIGISLDERGKRLAEQIVQIGRGRLYVIKDIEEADKVILEDYTAVGSE